MSTDRLDLSQTLPRVVTQRALTTPDRIYVRHVDGADLTYAEIDRTGRCWASALQQLGVTSGDRVATMLLPSSDSLCAWLGIAWLGAIDTGINTDFRGRMLQYVLELAEAEILIVDGAFVPEVDHIASRLTRLRYVVVVGSGPAALTIRTESAAHLLSSVDPMTARGPDQWDIACLTFTSGTTGPSKGVLVPWGQLHVFSNILFKIEDLGDKDVYLSPWPVYHTSGRLGAYMMALLGGTVVYKDRFRLTSWLDEIWKYGVTTMILWSPMIDLLRSTEPSDGDATIPLRNVCAQWPPDHAELAERYGLRMRSCFGMTEVPAMIVPEGWKIEDHRSMGKLYQGFPGFEARLVDEHDQEVPNGVPGELIVRSATPWTMNAGYFRNPEATAKAWRNGWFHTGDSLRCDSEGNFSFIDRTTDSIRRRGENISSYEVEEYVSDHPDVQECAAVAAPVADHLDQEVKIVVVRRAGSSLAAEDLLAFLIERMPRFMVPRYVEFVDELPRTESTMKIRKVELRATAINSATWDRQTGTMLDEPKDLETMK